MNKREKIVVTIAVIIGIYGFVDHVFLSSRENESGASIISRQKQEAENAAAQTAADLALIQRMSRGGDVQYLLKRIETPWGNDPFVAHDTIAKNNTGANARFAAVPELLYSGFIKIGPRLMAVINGMEYTTGETLKDIGLKISQITPTNVVLVNEANKEIVLTLQEN